MNDTDKELVERLRPTGDQLDARESSRLLEAVLAEPRTTRPRREPSTRRRLAFVLAAAAVVGGVGVASVVGSGVLERDSGGDGGNGEPGVGTAECQPLLRIDGIVYAAESYTEDIAARPGGQAELSSCADNGSDPAGSTFPDNPETASVVTLGGLPAEQVVGLGLGSGYTVYIAQDVPPEQQERILAELDSPQ